jgi:hypothetical protein
MLFAMLLNASAAAALRARLGVDAHRVVALAEAVRALGQHAQRAEVAAEDQPDELQHEEQRHRHDLQLLDELLPQPVWAFTGVITRGERAVSHPPAVTSMLCSSCSIGATRANQPARRACRDVLRDERLPSLSIQVKRSTRRA